ncbi:DUF411 domain-containing protein [Xanthomonas hortorum]|uniref:DUF411 domain-containing protein n=1 Tax=Xanthomonas hortorum TaxID=56454 RepID=UPI0032E9362D
MNTRSSLLMLGALTGTTVITACARAPQPVSAAAPVSHSTAAMAATASPALPRVVVHKSPSCHCCALWVKHLRDAGFVVDVRNEDNLNPIKERVGVPYGKGSCHTAEVGGYFVEGHVPAEDVKRLLSQRPDAKGLVLPGMPMGSPGMEMPDGRTQPYTVGLVGRDGMTTAFATH